MQYSNNYLGRGRSAEIRSIEHLDSEEGYRCLFEQATDLIVIHDMDGAIRNVNDSLCNRLGYTRDEMLRMNMADLIDPEQLKARPLRWKEISDGIRIFSERRYVCKDGSFIEIEANVKKMPNGMVMGVCRDVSERKKWEEQILHERNLSNEIIDCLPGVFFLQEMDGRYIRWNRQFVIETGYSDEEIRSINALDFFHGPERTKIQNAIAELFANPNGEAEIEAETVMKNGRIEDFFYKGKQIMYEGRPCLIGTGINITHRKQLEREMLYRNVQEQKRITRAVIKGQEEERNKIGQEMHDNVNQILASSNMYLRTFLNDPDGTEIRKELIEESSRMIGVAIEEIRMLSRNQITPQVKLGLRELIQLLADCLHENSSIQARFDYQLTDLSIDDDLKLNIYRIIQEQISNILKYARASAVDICLRSENGFLQVYIKDNGQGFDTMQKRNGIGITNIINRVDSFNGKFCLESSPGNGCKLDIRIPV
jgi:PAS domain S-box-containing protein